MTTDTWTAWAAKLLWVMIVPAALIAGGAIFGELTRLPLDDVNALRITAPVQLVHGYSMYALPGGGPITEYLYPPLSALFFAPAALASSPSGMLAIGGLLTIGIFTLPALWLHVGAGVTPWSIAGAIVFLLMVMSDLGLRYTACNIHVEAPAAGLTALAIGCVLPSKERGPGVVASALCAVLAVWTKQTVVLLMAVLPAYLWMTYGFATARRWVLSALVIGLAVSGVLVAYFGWRELYFTMITIPSRHKFYLEEQGGKLAGIKSSAYLLWLSTRIAVGVVLALMVGTIAYARGARAWLQENRWVGLALVSIVMVPTSILGASKFLSFLCAHTPTSFFMLAAATTGLAEVASRPGRARVVAAWGLVGLLGYYGWWIGRPLLAQRAMIAAQTRNFANNEHEKAYAFARAHPGAVYFPRNPLATLLADGRLDHSDWGLVDWEMGEEPPSRAHLYAALPPHMRWIAYRDTGHPNLMIRDPIALFPEFDRVVKLPELPGWLVFERSTP